MSNDLDEHMESLPSPMTPTGRFFGTQERGRSGSYGRGGSRGSKKLPSLPPPSSESEKGGLYLHSERPDARSVLRFQTASKLSKLIVNHSQLPQSSSSSTSERKSIPQFDYDYYHNGQLSSNPTECKVMNMRTQAVTEDMGWLQMHRFRTLPEKVELLKWCPTDYSTQISVLEFLKNSLGRKIFFNMLKTYPKFLRIYKQYLRLQGLFGELEELFKHVNDKRGVFFALLESSLIQQEKNTKQYLVEEDFSLQKRYRNDMLTFSKCVNYSKKYEDVLGFEHQQVLKWVHLIDRQVKIDEYDQKIQDRGTEPVYIEHPRSCIYGLSVDDFVEYLLFYHAYTPQGKLSSPLDNKNVFELSSKRYKYLSIGSRSRIGDWDYIRKLIPSIIKNRKHFPLDMFLDLVCKFNPEPELKENLLNAMKNTEEKYELAKMYGCFEIAIATAYKMKDVVRLARLKIYIRKQLGEQRKRTKGLVTLIDNLIGQLQEGLAPSGQRESASSGFDSLKKSFLGLFKK